MSNSLFELFTDLKNVPTHPKLVVFLLQEVSIHHSLQQMRLICSKDMGKTLKISRNELK